MASPSTHSIVSDEMRFKTGNVCRIYVKDFLTFKEVEIRPKPKLNLIYGSNGSGKSTLLCAICICLGGKPHVTGRGNEVYEYIRHRQEEATLEVELFVENGANLVVRRRFSKRNGKKSNTWYLQGKEVTTEDVVSCVEKLNIQVDNLCQFLPQDRVVEFAKLDNKTLLTATEKAVGDPTLYKQHMTLAQSSTALQQLQHSRTELVAELEEAERRNARLKTVVENMEVKEKLQQEIKELQTKKLWHIYNAKRKAHLENREALKVKEDDLSAFKSTLEPVLTQSQRKKKELHGYKKLIREKEEFICKCQHQLTKALESYEMHRDAISEARRSYAAKEQEHRQKEHEVTDYEKQLEVMMGQLSNLPLINEEVAQRKLRALTADITGASKSMVDLQGRITELGTEIEQKKSELESANKKLSEKKDIMSQRLTLLREKNGDAYVAAVWLLMNPHRFKGPIHPPIFTTLNVPNHTFARYVENRVQYRDLIAFVCEHKDDVNTLKAEMDKQGLSVNIIYSDPLELDRYKPPQPIAALRQYGFTHYMLEVVTGPPAVLSYLCRNYNIHAVPIALTEGDYDRVPHALSVFYMGNNRYSSNRSRYDGGVSTTIVQIRPPNLICILNNQGLIDQLTKWIKELQESISSCNGRLNQMREQEAQISSRLEGYRKEKREVAGRHEERQTLEQRIRIKKNQIERHRDALIDLVKEHAHMESVVAASIKVQVASVAKCDVFLASFTSGLKEVMRTEGKARVVLKAVEALEGILAEQELAMQDLETEVRSLREQLEALKQDGMQALKNLLQNLGLASSREITKEVKERYDNGTLESTEKLLAEKDAHLACIVSATAEQVQEFTERQKVMEKLRMKLEETEKQFNSHDSNVKEVRESWLSGITELIQSISNQFATFMLRLGYCGEVQLRVGTNPVTELYPNHNNNNSHNNNKNSNNNSSSSSGSGGKNSTANTTNTCNGESSDNSDQETDISNINLGPAVENERYAVLGDEDYSNYGLCIRVKFRKHQKLQDLTPHQQSGGERALSTALYLLSLQSLTAAPFRCVDEINQGMDPVNERMFVQMLMETEGEEGSSQYFFVSPKMLLGQHYVRGVNTMVVFNSSTNLTHSDHNIKKVLKLKKELKKKKSRGGGGGKKGRE